MPASRRCHGSPRFRPLRGRRSFRVAAWARAIGAAIAVGLLIFGRAGAQEDGQPLVEVRERPADPRGALDLDRTIVRLLRQADDYAAAGRYGEAIAIWQRALDNERGWLVTHDDLSVTTFGGAQYEVYRPVHAEVERTIMALPPDVIDVYRRDVDGAAVAALRGSHGDSRSLSDVVRKYLLSSSGREAVLLLASHDLDRGEFVRAARVLERWRVVSARLPGGVQPAILARLALAEASLGDRESALRHLAELRRIAVERDGDVRARQLAARVERILDLAASPWPSRELDTRDRPASQSSIRLAAALPEEAHIARITEAWFRSNRPVLRERLDPASSGDTSERGASSATVITVEDAPVDATEEAEQSGERWWQSSWVPAGDVLVQDGLAFFKGIERLVAVETATGDVRWMGLRNRFELTWSSLAFGQAGANAGRQARPATPAEIQQFGDGIQHSLALIDGTVYSLEGPPLDLDSDGGVRASAAEASRAVVRRSLSNRLAAYDARTGKLSWVCDPAKWVGNSSTDEAECGFIRAPVVVRRHLLAPVTREGELWLCAIDPQTGSVLWHVFLCDEPPGGCSPWAAVGLAVDGSEVYVATGAGLIFAVDGTSGRVEWAVQYRRNGIRETQGARPGTGFVVSSELDGWQRDAVLVHGPRLIVTPSDYGYAIALDRRDARLLWHSPRQPSDNDPAADVCLGVAGDGLFVAGRNVVRRYDLPSGRLVWETATGDSHGRGLLTAAALYVPVGSAVLRLDLETGAELSRSELISASREPLGNLATDGQRLLCLSGQRLYALLALDTHLERLANRIDDGDSDAPLERMRLRLRLGELDGAITDLRAACTLVERRQGPSAAARLLLSGLVELDLAEQRPELVLRLLTESRPLREPPDRASAAASPAANENEDSWKRSQLVHTALTRIGRPAGDRQRPPPGVSRPGLVQVLLDAAPLFQPAYLQMAARQAMAAVVTAADQEPLRVALTAADPAVRSLALAGVAVVFENDALPLLGAALGDADESVRFQAAVALVNRGERDALRVFVELLDSPDLELRSRSIATLRAISGENFGFVASAAADERAAKSAAWRAWLAEHGASAALRLPVHEAGIALGRTLISYTNNRLVELDDSGRAIWQQEVANPWGCQGLPNGHRLVASYSGRAVYEYDAAGRLVWERDDLPSSPYSVERLDSGNTLVSCYGANKVLEIAPDGSLAQEIDLPDHPRDARRLDDGRTLVALYSSGRVVEVDLQGKIVWETGGMNRPVAVQRLDNGNTLVCQYFGKQVVEIDRDGSTVWFKSGLEYPYDAQRLPTGNTLIVDRNGVQEVDPAGNVVREYPASGATSVWRY